jgi:hypothetical protein
MRKCLTNMSLLIAREFTIPTMISQLNRRLRRPEILHLQHRLFQAIRRQYLYRLFQAIRRPQLHRDQLLQATRRPHQRLFQIISRHAAAKSAAASPLGQSAATLVANSIAANTADIIQMGNVIAKDPPIPKRAATTHYIVFNMRHAVILSDTVDAKFAKLFLVQARDPAFEGHWSAHIQKIKLQSRLMDEMYRTLVPENEIAIWPRRLAAPPGEALEFSMITIAETIVKIYAPETAPHVKSITVSATNPTGLARSQVKKVLALQRAEREDPDPWSTGSIAHASGSSETGYHHPRVFMLRSSSSSSTAVHDGTPSHTEHSDSSDSSDVDYTPVKFTPPRAKSCAFILTPSIDLVAKHPSNTKLRIKKSRSTT